PLCALYGLPAYQDLPSFPTRRSSDLAIALPGAAFAALCLATGSIWGRPTWGTWWQWDGRLTSMLLLFFVYLGFMALTRADDDRGDRKSTRLNSSHVEISYAVFCLKKK